MNDKDYAITSFQKVLLRWITRKIVIQSREHENNIIEYYGIIAEAARDEFREDNMISLKNFLWECQEKTLKKLTYKTPIKEE